MPSRELGYPVFDADNHFYEPKEALTKFLPDHAKNAIDYIDVRGRTKIVVRGQISDYIPNPTFDVVARPGAQEDYYRNGNPEGKSFREIMGESMKAIPAFREPAARLEVMDDLGLNYSLMFPTLASLVEERMKDDPDLTIDIIHALNEWMYEQWQFDYEGRIFSTPVITLPNVDRAIEELNWCLERGAKTVLVRPAPVPGYQGTRSFGLPEFDPFWAACVEAGIPVSMHASDSGYAELLNTWEPSKEFLPFRPTAFRMAAMGHRPIEDAMMALVCHGALTRNPDLRILSIENGAGWIPYLFENLSSVYKKMPQEFGEDPIAAFKRCIYISPFWEDNFLDIVRLVGADRVVFGSDWPHPEGLADPITYVDDLEGLDQADIERIMGGNMCELFKIKVPVGACKRCSDRPDTRPKQGSTALNDVLAGVKVVEVAAWTFVPAAGAVLAEWGADVIKVEPREGGDPQRGLVTMGLVPAGRGGVNYMIEMPNRGKKSIAIDLSTDGGKEVLYKLVETADVFVTNYLPGVRKKLGIDLEDIRKINPGVIYVRGSAYGQNGPGADKPGYDGVSYWSRGGVGHQLTLGVPNAESIVSPRPAFGDVMGGMTIAGGIAAALFKKERTGEPSVVDVSLLGLAAWNLSPDVTSSKLYDKSPIPSFDRKSAPNPLVGNYKTKDDRFVTLMMLQGDRYFAEVCNVIGRPDLATDERYAEPMDRFNNRVELISTFDEVFASKTLAEWIEILDALSGAWGPVQSAYELHDDPDVIANGYVPTMKTMSGAPFAMPVNPVQFDGIQVVPAGAPEHGQHTEELLLEAGVAWEDIEKYKEAGAIL